MNPIKAARKLIERHPDSDEARALSHVVLALEANSQIDIATLYSLKLQTFELAIEVLQEWRLARYYAGKTKLFNLSVQVGDLPKGSFLNA